MSVALCLLLAGAAAPPPFQQGQREAVPPQGVTIPEYRDLAAQLADAERFVAEGNHQAAVTALQRVLEDKPHQVVRKQRDDLLYVGAAHRAREMIASLPQEALEIRERIVGPRAAEELRAALQPPDFRALRRITLRYAGTDAARRAHAALEELLLDRGYPQRAAGGRPLGEIMPPEWVRSLPAPQPRAALEIPSYESLDDPALPRVRAKGLRESWRYRFQDPPFQERYYANHRAAVGGGIVYLTDSREVVALELATGEVVWRFDGPKGWQAYSSDTARGRERRERLMEGFNSDVILAPVLEDGVLLAALQEPVYLGRSDEYRRIAVRRYLPGRRLFAFDAATGEQLWQQDVPWHRENQKEPTNLVAAPPAAAAGRVFVPVYNATGTVDLSLLALDLHSGAPLWKTFLVSGSRESNLFGNVLSELASSPPLAAEDRVLICTNLGAICSVEAATGATLWTRLYPRTRVDTSQTGDVSYRQETFSNQPVAFDGQRMVCAPTDSDLAYALDAESGEIQAMWRWERSFQQQRLALRNLAGVVPEGAFFSGTHATFQPLPNHAGRTMRSERIPERHAYDEQQRGPVLAKGELLVPSVDGLVRIDPRSGRMLGSRIPWPEPYVDNGTLQAAPGMLLVMIEGGVLALASPHGLLESLPADADLRRIAQVLPLLEGLDLREDAAIARQVSIRTRELASSAANREQRERLWMVAASALLDLADTGTAERDAEDAAQLLVKVLDSPDAERRVSAATWLIDSLERRDPGDPRLGRALSILEADAGPGPVRRRSGWEPTSVILERARYLAARDRGHREAERRLLLELLTNPESEKVYEDGMRLSDWAGVQLERLLLDPSQRAALERDAARVFDRGRPTTALIRAFAGTETVAKWIENEARRPDLSRAEEVELAALVRDLPTRGVAARALLDLRKLFHLAEQRRLPGELTELQTVELPNGARLLAARPTPDGALILWQDGSEVVLASVDGKEGRQSLAAAYLGEPGTRVSSLSSEAFLTDRGATVVYRSQWIHLGVDGSAETLELPGRADAAAAPIALGRMAALLCRDGERKLRLQVRDLDTGALFLDKLVPSRSPDVSQQLVAGEGSVFLLQRRSRTVLRFDLLEDDEPRSFQLPKGPELKDMSNAVAYGKGLVIPNTSDPTPRLVIAGTPQERVLDQTRQAELVTFAATHGVGWLQRPLMPSGVDAPKPVLSFLADGRSQPQTLEFHQSELKIPQVSDVFRRRSDVHGTELLAISRTPRDVTQVQAIDLGGAGVAPHFRWRLELGDLQYRHILRTRQPRPAQAAGGWLLPLLSHRGRSRPSQLRCLLLDDQGSVLDEYRREAPSRSSEVEVFLLDGTALLRSGPFLILLGQP